jgi:hypothetical protein
MSPIKATVDITWFDILLFVANDLEPSWTGTSNVSLCQHPRGLNFQSLTIDFGDHGTTREHYRPLHSIFSTGCHWARRKHLHFGAALLKKAKKWPCLYAALLMIYLFTSLANWYVTHIEAKIKTCKTDNKIYIHAPPALNDESPMVELCDVLKQIISFDIFPCL